MPENGVAEHAPNDVKRIHFTAAAAIYQEIECLSPYASAADAKAFNALRGAVFRMAVALEDLDVEAFDSRKFITLAMTGVHN